MNKFIEYFILSFFVILIIGVLTGLLLKYPCKIIGKYFYKIIKIINMISSSIFLIPIQLAFSLLIVFSILSILISIFEKYFIITELSLLLIFSSWLILIPFLMKILWKPCKYISNSINDNFKLPENVSEFIGYIFYGKIFIYLLALIFVIINTTELKVPFLSDETFEELKKILNSSILIFIAADRIITSIQNWFKNKFCNEPH